MLEERQRFDELRERVRASRRATSAPLLVFGVTVVIFAGYDGLSDYSFVPLPLFYVLCSVVALLALACIDRFRRRRTGVGAGRLSYGRTAAILLGVIVVGNLLWFYPFARQLLWPASVLTFMALWQRNKSLALRSGIIGTVMILGWLASQPLPFDWLLPAVMAGGGLALVVTGLVERARERTIE
ncbi:fatty acid desaturase [Actinoplanes octamycinicus]|uniref:Fatty acid desaturase n=1 Tax=Actinoplanes octamycinicus TaxID=135948 RepID=A0A7W7M6Y4_9ACTN|nr:hypothetical protein [Actinoplanes octamycinicus]MBB4739337.1 fatty acid desaturase [Actinoplanes octamycinicus]GIE58687.1 hypothetical protein Aoc01nite_40890 [Actinoplanes octamycinicus]